MRIGDIISFRNDLYFEGAVQADWFYTPEKSAKVAESFVFHGKDYHGACGSGNGRAIDTVSLVRTFVQKLNDEVTNPLSLAIADYGTGKSHFAVTLAQLFSGPDYMPETFSAIIRNIGVIDPDVASFIKDSCSGRNFVLVINGMRDFNLHYELLRAVHKSLRIYGLSDDKLKNLNRAVETAGLFFDRNKDSQLPLFEKSAVVRGWTETGSALVSRIKDSLLTDNAAFDIINDVYLQVTGKEICWDEGISAAAILEMLLSEYCGLNGQFDHVIILFDEFGRYLEYASGSDVGKSGDSALQQIFEVSQNAAGALNVINFIQSDIKSYMVRVDQTRNISRYIGRYDQSDKYRISSNLETVFANLIARKDREAFKATIVKWQNENESLWKDIHRQMSSWLPLNGLWSDYDSFRKVVVEGIYPMHPLSTYMLSQLSDYLQNRSSLSLISQCISEISGSLTENGVPLVMPENLMKGELYQEMLSSEINGKQMSQHCMRFDSILRKYGDKFSPRTLSVLRANLIIRILRFKTRDYEDAKAALILSSGLSQSSLNYELTLLENEYAVLGFDSNAGCFDFMDDSKGAYEYKIFKNRLASSWRADLRTMFKTARVLELGEVSETQESAFGVNHKILTNEWKFKQELIMAEDVSESLADNLLNSWRESRNASQPKGRLLWIFVRKGTDIAVLDNLRKLSRKFQGTPIVILLLNDAEGSLERALSNYDFLNHLDDNTRKTYDRAYSDDYIQAEDNLRIEFDSLKKERLCVFPDEICKLGKRLHLALTDVFENLYPEVISFNFDGLLTSSNNFTGKGSMYFCQIVKMLLSNGVNYDAIHDTTIDVRNKIAAVLEEKGATSWKCISAKYSITPPAELKARAVYDGVLNQLNSNHEYNCRSFFETYCYPPYGLSEEAAIMMLAVILANNSYTVRIQYGSEQCSVIRWKDEVISKDKKINLDLIKESKIVVVDNDEIEARFQRLCNKVSETSDIDEIISLQPELMRYEFNGEIPDSLEMNFRFAKSRIDASVKAIKNWNERIVNAEDELEFASERTDVYRALTALEILAGMPISSVFTDNGFTLSGKYRNQIEDLQNQANSFIKNNFNEWMNDSIHCKSVEAISQFDNHVRKCSSKFERFGFKDFARKLLATGELEISRKDEIRSRQELLADGERFFTAFEKTSLKIYIDVQVMIDKAKDLLGRLSNYEKGLGHDARTMHKKLDDCVKRLTEAKNTMKQKMAKVWDDLTKAQSIKDLDNLILEISQVMDFRIPAKDLADYEDLKNTLSRFKSDLEELDKATKDRIKLADLSAWLRNKYAGSEMDFDVSVVLENAIKVAYNTIDDRDRQWRDKYLTLGDCRRETIHRWRESIRILPAYLRPETIDAVAAMKAEAEKIISAANIEDVVFYFKRLTEAERKQCLTVLAELSGSVNNA